MKADVFTNCPFCLNDLKNETCETFKNSLYYIVKSCSCGYDEGGSIFVCGYDYETKDVIWLVYTFHPVYLMIEFDPIVQFSICDNHSGKNILSVSREFLLPDPYNIQDIEKRTKLYLTFS